MRNETSPIRHAFEINGIREPLRVARFDGREAISRLFEFRVTLAAEDGSLPLGGVVGSSALLTIRGEGEPRLVHGMISRFEQGDEGKDFTIYHATLVPRAYRLFHRYDCRIFQVLTVPDIIEKVLKAAGFGPADYQLRLYARRQPKEYSVQYRETDWGFISRLMEEEGIFCYFDHSDGKDVLVLGDAPFAHADIPGTAAVPYRPSGGVITQEEHVTRFRYAEEVRPGKVTMRDYNFKTPSLSLEASAQASRDADLEVYDFPGEYTLPADGAGRAKNRLEDWQSMREAGEGEGSVVRLIPGFVFKLEEHPRDAFNRRYLLVEVEHHGTEPLMGEIAGDGASYRNTFRVIPAEVPFRPAERTPKPTSRGVQTAIVVGPAGDEIYTDEYGRVKVQFHWDRQGKHDEHSSCWIRVSQLWAGQAYGAMYIPRIGHEVIIDYIEGDTDRPIIVGRVYHGTNVTPYALPGDKTRSTIKTNSSPGGGGSNELRFEDQKGEEEIYLHGQKDWTIHIEHDKNQIVGHDETLDVGNDRAKKVGHNQREKIGVNKNIEVGQNHTEAIGVDESVTVGQHSTHKTGKDLTIEVGQDKTIQVERDHKENIGGKRDTAVGGKSTDRVSGDRSDEVGGKFDVAVKGNLAVTVDGASAETITGAKTIDSADSVTIKSGGSTVVIKSDGTVTIDCKDLKVKASGQVKIDGSSKVAVKCSGPVEVKGSEVTVKGNSIELN